MVKVSHSAKDLFLRSPRAYFLRYILGLKEAIGSSALVFGNAFDKGSEILVKERNLSHAVEAFREDLKKIDFDTIRIFTADKPEDPSQDNKEFLLERGTFMLEQYAIQVLPKIKEVLGTQEEFEITNAEGDSIIGFSDLRCIWEDGRHLILDHKTASQPYKSIKESGKGSQLAIYDMAFSLKHQIDGTGFIVMNKKFRKRKEPKVVIEELIEVTPEETKEETLEQFGGMIQSIKMGEFPCHTPKCDFNPYMLCPYKRYCESNGKDLTGLVKTDKLQKITKDNVDGKEIK